MSRRPASATRFDACVPRSCVAFTQHRAERTASSVLALSDAVEAIILARDSAQGRDGGAAGPIYATNGSTRSHMLALMQSLDHATLSADERAVLERFVEVLRSRLGHEVGAVWLFGSRARGETVSELSDIDVLVVADRAGWAESSRAYEALHDAAREVSLPEVAWSFSLQVRDPRWLQDRRAVGSFFASELDRDHIDVLTPT